LKGKLALSPDHSVFLNSEVLCSSLLAFLIVLPIWVGLSTIDPLAFAVEPGAKHGVDFDRQIRPILSDNCFTCHGPDDQARKADLRLDLKGGLLGSEEVYGVVEPGSRKDSELFRRITTPNPAERMPPPSFGKSLSEHEIELIGRWIDEGANWEEHWSFVVPQRPALPSVRNDAWCRNPIDRFILARLEAEGLAPSPEADKVTLIRRVTLDLTGLPPTPAEVDAFLADNDSGAYERVLDRLFASPRYGEHMARYWLDVARYGDTHGLHLDNYRSMWPYRDWVIQAFQQNKPYDQFIIEQVAGDLLPEATLEQRVASGFNRCNVTTSEGGSIDAEVLVRYAVDRTNAIGTAFLGLTLGCAQCHDHKYDPISQRDYYRMYAFFYSMADPAMDGNIALTPPVVRLPSPEQAAEQSRLQSEMESIKNSVEEILASVQYEDPEAATENLKLEPREFVWIDDEVPPGAQLQAEGPAWDFVTGPEHPVHSGQKAVRRSAEGRSQHFFTGAQLPLKPGAGDLLFAYVYLDPANPPRQLMLQWNDGSWEHRAYWGENLIEWGTDNTPSRQRIGDLPPLGQWIRLEVPIGKVGLKPGGAINGWAFTQFGGTVYWDSAGVVTKVPQPDEPIYSLRRWELIQKQVNYEGLPDSIKTILGKPADQRSEDEKKQLREYFLMHVYPETREKCSPLLTRRSEIEKRLAELDQQIPGTLVSADLPQPREAFVLERGDYEKPREKVEPNVPAAFAPLQAEAPRNRLGLAQWLVDRGNPLTARVAVNRIWQQIFGVGLVKTAEDFGSQGERPTHPELLDWLAVEFIESGWDVQHLLRLILTSATYRQSAKVTPELLARDPENRLLGRGPRFRLDAEAIRDTALFVSGLLVEQVGGPSVKPYQPSGLWEAVGYTTSNTARFVQDHGEKLYRRSLYTFWKRTSPPPNLTTFDAPAREDCTVRRARTNTPLQALVLMNDVQFVEAARKMAERLMKEGGETTADRVLYGFRLVAARAPKEDELAVLIRQYDRHYERFSQAPQAALQLLAVGESPRDESLDPAQVAAWTLVCNVLLNLDESITK